MAEACFDPASFYQFDLAAGEVRARGGGRVVVLSETVLAPLVAAAVEQNDLTALRRLGKQLGELAGVSLGAAAVTLPTETVLGHLAGVLSLFGWGRLGLERWGHALVAEIQGLPVLDDDHLGIAALLGGVFSSLAGRETACVPVNSGSRESEPRHGATFLVVDPGIAERVWEWSRSAESLPAILARLSPGGVP